MVAPLAGAWIETFASRKRQPTSASRPSRARGLKPSVFFSSYMAARSRPSRARGLKHLKQQRKMIEQEVAPLAGAWIETVNLSQAWLSIQSRPSRARGLKLNLNVVLMHIDVSRPSRARGLKHHFNVAMLPIWVSRPSRARGLKRPIAGHRASACRSRPSRARGLKRKFRLPATTRTGRAPRGRVD